MFSFNRYRPGRDGVAGSGSMDPEQQKWLLLSRANKTAVHELGHMFGIGHCVHRQCCMNGSGHLREDFAIPEFLCPVDLAKFRAVLGPNFNPVGEKIAVSIPFSLSPLFCFCKHQFSCVFALCDKSWKSCELPSVSYTHMSPIMMGICRPFSILQIRSEDTPSSYAITNLDLGLQSRKNGYPTRSRCWATLMMGSRNT